MLASNVYRIQSCCFLLNSIVATGLVIKFLQLKNIYGSNASLMIHIVPVYSHAARYWFLKFGPIIVRIPFLYCKTIIKSVHCAKDDNDCPRLGLTSIKRSPINNIKILLEHIVINKCCFIQANLNMECSTIRVFHTALLFCYFIFMTKMKISSQIASA